MFRYVVQGVVWIAVWSAAGAVLASEAAPTDKKEGGEKVAFRTAYLEQPVGEARRIVIKGTLGGEGTVQLDGNVCGGIDPFGDPGFCTLKYYPPIPVEFVQLRLADTTGQKRRIYAIRGMLEPEGSRYYLVVPPSCKTAAARLVFEKSEKHRRAITLEPIPAAETGPREKVKTILNLDYTIQTSNPPNLVVTATGQVPTGGWKDARLDRRVYVQFPPDGIWDYDLTAVPPSGPAPTVISQVNATDVWKGFPAGKLKGVRVHGVGDGVKEVRFDAK